MNENDKKNILHTIYKKCMIGSSLCWNEEFQLVADEFLNLDTLEKSIVTPVHKKAKDGRESCLGS